MLTNYVQNISDIGEIEFHRNVRAKNLRIRVLSDTSVRVTIPKNLSHNDALSFVNAKKNWIKTSKAKQQLRNKHNAVPILDEHTSFKTRYHNLKIETHTKNTLRGVISSGTINIFYPQHARIDDPRIQEYIKKLIIEALRMEAKAFLPERLTLLAQKHGLSFNKVSVRNNKTRWGSCSYHNNISLNVHLMRLPGELIDYVLIHELIHTIIKNHSKNFWQKMEELLPGAKNLDKQLNKFSLHQWV